MDSFLKFSPLEIPFSPILSSVSFQFDNSLNLIFQGFDCIWLLCVCGKGIRESNGQEHKKTEEDILDTPWR